jgi:hypothetical protein
MEKTLESLSSTQEHQCMQDVKNRALFKPISFTISAKPGGRLVRQSNLRLKGFYQLPGHV